MATEELLGCPDCGRTLIIHNGITMCPTEDRPEPQPAPAILLMGEPVSNPFSPTSGKNIFNIMHDRAHARKIKEWYGK